MKLSVFYQHLVCAAEQRGMALADVMREAKALGIDWVEIGMDELLQDREGILRALREAGLSISCIYGHHDWGHTSDTDSLKAHVDTALACGARSILVIPGQLPEEETAPLWQLDSQEAYDRWMDRNPHVQHMVQGVRDTVAYADGRLTVTMEDFDQRTAVYAGIYGLSYFLRRAPGLGLAFDCGNFAYIDDDAMAAFDLIGAYTVHVHCKDRGEESAVIAEHHRYNRGLAPVATGHGYLPLREIVTRLLQRGYDGIFAIEHFGAEDQLQTIRDSAAFLKAVEAEALA